MNINKLIVERMQVIHGDITTLRVDAIVNAVAAVAWFLTPESFLKKVIFCCFERENFELTNHQIAQI